MLHRLRGYALIQCGDLEGAADALEESMRSASADTESDAEAESYELALTLEAVGRLSRLRGEDDGGARDKSEAVFSRLGVVARTAAPLPTNVS